MDIHGKRFKLGPTPEFRQIDASHDSVFIDRDRCILCGRCVRASRDLDGKHVFDFAGRGAAS